MLAAMVSVAADIYLYSNGAETYADGTPALSGECVALVWQKSGTTFDGFTADGWVAGEEGPGKDCLLVGFYDDIVYNEEFGFSWLDCGDEKIALNGAAGWEPYFSSGTFSVYFLDTRVMVSETKTCGFDPDKKEKATEFGFEGIPYRINAWQPFNGLTNLTLNVTTIYGKNDDEWGDRELDPEYPPEEGYYIGTCAATASAVPTNCPTAVVSSLSVAGGVATVTVTNTAPYLSYNLATSNDVQALAAKTVFAKGDLPNEAKQGAAAATEALVWQIPVAGEKGFFKVVRQPIK